MVLGRAYIYGVGRWGDWQGRVGYRYIDCHATGRFQGVPLLIEVNTPNVPGYIPEYSKTAEPPGLAPRYVTEHGKKKNRFGAMLR